MAAFVLTGCVNAQASGTASSEASSVENQVEGQESIKEAGLASSSGVSSSEAGGEISFEKPTDLLEVIPEYSGEPYAVVNGNVPFFKAEELTTEAFETYSELDDLGRCGVAYANICDELQPTEKRGSISAVRPTGWVQKKYDFVDGKSLYNRCHLIGFQLAGENANKLNLITGTRYFNVDGMLPFEDKVDDYIEANSKNHVLYRVTPIFEGNNLVATGVMMEAKSVEDDGVVSVSSVTMYSLG